MTLSDRLLTEEIELAEFKGLIQFYDKAPALLTPDEWHKQMPSEEAIGLLGFVEVRDGKPLWNSVVWLRKHGTTYVTSKETVVDAVKNRFGCLRDAFRFGEFI